MLFLNGKFSDQTKYQLNFVIKIYLKLVESILNNFSLKIYKDQSDDVLQEYQLDKLTNKVSFASKESNNCFLLNNKEKYLYDMLIKI